MPVEDATYISEMNPEWPAGTEKVKEGDDHIREIKAVLQNTLPKLDGPVTGTPEQLNNLTDGIQYVPTDGEGGTGWGVDAFAVRTPTGNGTHGEDAPMHIGTVDMETVNLHPGFAVNWQMIMDIIYPVGRVIISTKSTNPADYLGFGTWTAMSGYLAGVGSVTDPQGSQYGMTAGAPENHGGHWRIKNNTIVATEINLSMDKMDGHAHTVANVLWTGGSGNAAQGGTSDAPGKVGTPSTNSVSAGTPSGKVTIGEDADGTGSAHVPPYYGVYVWERTA